MSADSLDRWIASLAGRDIDGGSAEGRAMRTLIQGQPREALMPVAQIDPARESELIARARSVGLLRAQAPSPFFTSNAVRRRLTLPRAAMIAAVMAGIVVGASMLRSLRNPAETYRGAVNGVVEFESRDPLALKQRLMRELKGAGVTATGYQRLNRVGLDADLPLPVTPAVQRVLEQHHIPVPKDGVLVIEIQPPENP